VTLQTKGGPQQGSTN